MHTARLFHSDAGRALPGAVMDYISPGFHAIIFGGNIEKESSTT
jgi:hypothetical protein